MQHEVLLVARKAGQLPSRPGGGTPGGERRIQVHVHALFELEGVERGVRSHGPKDFAGFIRPADQNKDAESSLTAESMSASSVR